MAKRHLDLMSESDYRRLIAENEAWAASLGEVDIETTSFGVGIEAMSDEQIDDACTSEVRRGR